MPGDDDYQMLGPARERYYRLVLVLAESRWQERLRRELPLLREVLVHQEALDALLGAEAWPEGHSSVRTLSEVASLREQLVRDVARKLGRDPHEPFGVLMRALEDWLITLPREVPAHLREETARELLPDTLPALRDAQVFGERLESLFAQPLLLAGRLPFSNRQREELALGWPRGEAALASLWRRLSGVDARGFMVAELRERAALAPGRAPSTGPEHLLHAEYWYQEARSRLTRMARLRLAPLEPSPSECLTVMWWLFEREYVPQVRLLPSDTLSEARAALIEVAYELWDAQRTDIPADERWTTPRWARLERLAARADEARNAPGIEPVREALRQLLPRHGNGTTRTPRGWWTTPSLVDLVRQVRDVLG
ncbi:hypothetical protein [Melittangium boletus]|uniref:Uncharacterized protein n=1 Tax=Melittangium boletus DSM 14713 TaxID=1294270 RepID=A0A250IHU7_9BACT|nr:hypothetical protein [Melittangium boletus]ATB30742.1 hypothetical protein MEBOL_004203 [Melittangium boletus DSM 14713]